jgi:hypothetical protein
MAMCWNGAQALPLALLCLLLQSQYSTEAAYSPAIVRIDTGSSTGPFTDAGGNIWASDTDSNGGKQALQALYGWSSNACRLCCRLVSHC